MAETAGISKAKVTIVALCISGCIAGLAGASHVLSVDRRLINGFSNDYGFSGISVAALAADSLWALSSPASCSARCGRAP